ncbi:M15 family metallopeptidase [Kocuria palustris]|uniref:M15 family metallopeptidase n=1 Tax=Kocuria palustris TaxID=71999 RepID=UPI0011A233AF|nr:M15 family metallopeptidase [Kocuria palustris]
MVSAPRGLAASATLLLLLGAAGCGADQQQDAPEQTASAGGPTSEGRSAEDGSGPAAADTGTASSTDAVVNKQRPLEPQDYAPEPLADVEGHQLREDAAAAAEEMLAQMRAEGIPVSISSAYRSYDEQVSTYQHWVDVNGQETADTISARPGHSEHQTGLAMDLADGTGCDLQECFADTEAAKWAAQHAHEHGFVLRFPEDGQQITGYAYEPWHYRYVGEQRAQEFHDSAATTLEEFYGTGPAPDYS